MDDQMSHILNIIFVLLVAWLTAYTASKKGRSPVFWFILGMFFSVFALLFLIFLPPVPKKGRVFRGNSGETPFDGTTIEVKPLSTTDESVDLKSPERKEWYYLDDQRQQTGPISFETLKNLCRTSIITPSTYIWCEGMQEWKKLSDMNMDVS